MIHTPPAFPPELEREIFEMTALMHPGAIPTLSRVAYRTHVWIEPLLYRVVRVNGDPAWSGISSALLRATKLEPAPSFFHNVRHILLDTSAAWDFDGTRNVLNLCTGLVDLAVIGVLGTVALDPAILPILQKIQLRRFSAVLARLFGGSDLIDLTHPAFASITHLNIFDEIGERIRAQIPLPLLPTLTHLALYEQVPWDLVKELLEECPRLHVLLVAFHKTVEESGRDWARKAPIDDVRFVVTQYTDYTTDWEGGAKGLADFWSLADDFVARK
ncbi:hypothetical protein FB451DRAFT_1379198 [Mycena latifolia]|nr:hypothetical protein FB451DRAFT_1379198 [Mycena latifolia]